MDICPYTAGGVGMAGKTDDSTMSLFGDLCEEKAAPSLLVLVDGKPVDMTLDEMFDTRRYDTFEGVSYVSSPRFFSERVKGFRKVRFILGIDDSDVAKGFDRGVRGLFDIPARCSFFDGMEDDGKDMAVDGRMELRYSKIGDMFHTKFYLLSNSETGETRVVAGSANFSAAAFSQDNKNFESVEVFSDKMRFDSYKEYFDELYSKTVDYVPERLKRDRRERNVVTDSSKLYAEILVEERSLGNLPDVIPVDMMEGMKQYHEMVFECKDVDITQKIIDGMTSRKTQDGYPLKPAKSLVVVKLENLVCRSSKKSASTDKRKTLSFNTADCRYYEKETESSREFLLDRRAPQDELRSSLLLVDRFLSLYKKYSKNPSVTNQSKIFEALLFSFFSPYFWLLRREMVVRHGASESASIPIFLILGGRGNSGKTTALGFIATLLGMRENGYVSYSDVSTAGVISDAMYSSNAMPYFVDEIGKTFFQKSNSENKGENMIKGLANKTPTHSGPALVGTTNADAFSASGQVARRIIYLEVSNVFDESRKMEAMPLLDEVKDSVDDTLFRDFCSRVSAALADKEDILDEKDPLAFARKTFRMMYADAGLDVPSYFPEKPFNDYAFLKAKAWNLAFKNYPQFFKVNGDRIICSIDDLCKYSDRKQKETYRDLLDDACLVDGKGVIWELDKKQFLRFIGKADEPPAVQENSGLLSRIKGIFGQT